MSEAAAPRRVGTVALRVGWILLAVSSPGILAAPITILATGPDLTTRTGRHLFAGAAGLAAVAIVELFLAVVPIRRGERWAVGVAALPFVIVAIPVLVVDATFVAPARLWNTLAPQVAGLVLGVTALALCAVGSAQGKR